jgi:tetratricopeptide (TPR) repeat protein
MIWIFNIIDIMRIIWWRERENIKKLKEPLFLTTFSAYIQNDLEVAEKQLRKLLRIDRDDTDALFYMGVISFRKNKIRRAKRCFEKSLQFDEARKWTYEIENILESNRV